MLALRKAYNIRMRSGKISSGVWLCLVLGLFALAVPLAFYRYARSLTNLSQSTIPIGVPSRPLNVISLNIRTEAGPTELQISRIRELDPDFVFLIEVHGKSLGNLQRQLGGRLTQSAYYPLQNRQEAETDVGVAILSKYPLREGRPIPNHMNGACGVWAVAEIEGRRFYVACLKISESGQQGTDPKAEMGNFRKAWTSLGKPPILAAVAGNVSNEFSLEKNAVGFHSPEWLATESDETEGLHVIRFVGRNHSETNETTDQRR